MINKEAKIIKWVEEEKASIMEELEVIKLFRGKLNQFNLIEIA